MKKAEPRFRVVTSSRIFVLILCFLVPFGGAVSSQVATSSKGDSVPFRVCEQSPSWERPSEAIQAKIWNDPRYRGYSGNFSYEWNHYFFQGSGSASLSYHSRNEIGMWTAKDRQFLCDDPGRGEKVSTGEQGELWILLHEVRAIYRQGTVYTVVVERTGKGFQVVNFPTPEGRKEKRTFIFEVPSGVKIEALVEGVSPGA